MFGGRSTRHKWNIIRAHCLLLLFWGFFYLRLKAIANKRWWTMWVRIFRVKACLHTVNIQLKPYLDLHWCQINFHGWMITTRKKHFFLISLKHFGMTPSCLGSAYRGFRVELKWKAADDMVPCIPYVVKNIWTPAVTPMYVSPPNCSHEVGNTPQYRVSLWIYAVTCRFPFPGTKKGPNVFQHDNSVPKIEFHIDMMYQYGSRRTREPWLQPNPFLRLTRIMILHKMLFLHKQCVPGTTHKTSHFEDPAI